MSKRIPLSWSRLSVFRQCPSQFYQKYITKEYPDEGDNPAFAKGTAVHKQLEDYINWRKGKGKEPQLGNLAKQALPIIDKYFDATSPDAISAEKQLALGDDWKEVSWFDNSVARWRGILDMLVIPSPDTLILIDFKTGKVRPYADERGQLHLSAAMLFELYPAVDTIVSAYLFVEHKQSDVTTFKRKDHAKNKAAFEIEWQLVNEEAEWEPTKNQYCYFCLVKGDCKYG